MPHDFLTHCNPPSAATLEVLAFELRDEIRRLKAERDDARAEADRLRAELPRLARERDEASGVIEGYGETVELWKAMHADACRSLDEARAGAAGLRKAAPGGFVYHLPDGSTVTITPGR